MKNFLVLMLLDCGQCYNPLFQPDHVGCLGENLGKPSSSNV